VEQRAAWQALRREHPAPSCYLLGYVIEEQAWRFYDRGGPLDRPTWRDGLGTEYRDDRPDLSAALRRASRDAESAALERGVEALAVVDLFGAEGPKVKQWISVVGKGQKPPPDRIQVTGTALRLYLDGLQARGDQLRGSR
jgi:hypothetical protein